MEASEVTVKQSMDRATYFMLSLILSLVLVYVVSCSSTDNAPITFLSQAQPHYSSIGDYLSAQGCTRSVFLSGPTLTRTYAQWNPSQPLDQNDFARTFNLRYGVEYSARRSPVEVETLVMVYEQVRAEIESHPEKLNLPAGYKLTQQDKADLFYVTSARGGLAIRDLLEPLLLSPIDVLPDAECPPVVVCPPVTTCLPTPACPPISIPVPCPDPITCPPPVPVPTLSPDSLSTLNSLNRWVIGNGRKSKVNRLVREILNIINNPPPSPRSTAQVNVVVVN